MLFEMVWTIQTGVAHQTIKRRRHSNGVSHRTAQPSTKLTFSSAQAKRAKHIETAKPFKRRRHKNGFSHSNSEARNGVSHRTAKPSTKLNQETPKAHKRHQPLNGEALNEVKRRQPTQTSQILLSFPKIVVILHPILFNCAMGSRVRDWVVHK